MFCIKYELFSSVHLRLFFFTLTKKKLYEKRQISLLIIRTQCPRELYKELNKEV